MMTPMVQNHSRLISKAQLRVKKRFGAKSSKQVLNATQRMWSGFHWQKVRHIYDLSASMHISQATYGRVMVAPRFHNDSSRVICCTEFFFWSMDSVYAAEFRCKACGFKVIHRSCKVYTFGVELNLRLSKCSILIGYLCVFFVWYSRSVISRYS